MIKVIRNGDMFERPDALLVCPTNCEGVMGRGLAKYFKSFNRPGFFDYRRRCKSGEHTLDNPVLVGNERKFLCVATKDKWREDSTLSGLNRSVKGLVKWLNEHPDVLSLALPMLGGGAGNRFGKMERTDIGLVIIKELKEVKHCNVYFYI